MAVTIKQVAKEAGISIATVSRVLNGKGRAGKATIRRVHEATERLGYVPHGAARSLITNRTDTIGVLLPDIFGEYFSELIRGIDASLRKQGFHLLVSSARNQVEDLTAGLRTTRGRVDGLIIMSPHLAAPALRGGLPPDTPLVVLNAPPRMKAYHSVSVDNFGGARMMTEHLIKEGHRRIAFVSGPAANTDAIERRRGYREALRSHGFRLDGSLDLSGDFTEESGRAAGRALLHLSKRPSAVFAANDAMAIGVLIELGEAGFPVPNGMAVTGFDDIPLARYVAPALTTVGVPIAELGGRAAERLIELIRAGTSREPFRETVRTRLVLRDSCGPHALREPVEGFGSVQT